MLDPSGGTWLLSAPLEGPIFGELLLIFKPAAEFGSGIKMADIRTQPRSDSLMFSAFPWKRSDTRTTAAPSASPPTSLVAFLSPDIVQAPPLDGLAFRGACVVAEGAL